MITTEISPVSSQPHAVFFPKQSATVGVLNFAGQEVAIKFLLR